MNRLSRAVAIAAATVALALAASGCKKDEAKKPEEAKTDPASPPATETAPPASAPAPAEPAAQADPAPSGAEATPPAAPSAPPGQRPASVTEEHVAVADKVVEATNKFAEELDAAKSDCKKATAVVKSGGPQIKAAMENTEKLQTQLNNDPAAMEWFQQTYAPKMMGAVSKLSGVFNNCGKDKEFEEAFKSLDLGHGSAPPPAKP